MASAAENPDRGNCPHRQTVSSIAAVGHFIAYSCNATSRLARNDGSAISSIRIAAAIRRAAG
jgi:hypothetical protein